MPSVHHLPVEILEYIFQDVAKSDDRHKERRSFPFNVASVCTFWSQIAKSNGSFWQDISIDVADDPSPFLDTFNLFKNRHNSPLTINVFNTQKPMECAVGSDNWRARRDMENTRTRLLFEHLRPALPRFMDIVFNLEFQSSLPSAADILVRDLPRLWMLILGCSVYDIDEKAEIKVALQDAVLPLRYRSPSLFKLDLTGHAFMELAQLGADWISEFQQRRPANAVFKIRRFTFDEFTAENHDDSRSLLKFLKMICNSHGILKWIELEDLSLSYYPPQVPQIDPQEFTIVTNQMVFKAVSPDFLSTFFAHTRFSDHSLAIDFDSCLFPATLGELTRPLEVLCFKNISFDAHLDDSKFTIMSDFKPDTVTLIDCSGVNDAFFARLTGNGDCAPSNFISTLAITDCDSTLTVQALQSYVSARANLVQDSPGLTGAVPLEILHVDPPPTMTNMGECYIQWQDE